MQQSHLLYIMGNMFVIIYSVCISMALYKMVEYVATVDAKDYPLKHFRGDRNDIRSAIYTKIEFFLQDMYDEDMDGEQEQEEELKYKNTIYSPFQVCYVNSYRVYDSNSTTFDYTKETEYNVAGFFDADYANDVLGLNQLYLVFDDIHMVFSVKYQQCIKYPDIYRRDEL